MGNSLIFYLAIYIILIFTISYFSSRRQDQEDFLIAGRNRKGWQILLSKFAASIGAGYFITYTGFAYEYGSGVFAMMIGLVIGFLIFSYWAAPKIFAGSKENKFYTIGHFVLSKTKSKFSKNLADIVSSIILFSWLLVGIIGSGKIISDFGLMSYNWAVIISSAVVLGYLLLAGYKAVITTDIIQSVVIFVLMIIITASITKTSNFNLIDSSLNSTVDIATAVGFFLFGTLSVFSYSDRYQLSYASKSKRGLKNGLGFSIIPVGLVAYMLFLIGVFMSSNLPGLDSGLVFVEALKNFLGPKILPFAIVLFFAGIMSSADTNIYAISSHYAMMKESENHVKVVRKSIILLTVFVTILAIIFPDVVDVSIVAGVISMLLSWAMIYLIAGGTNNNRFVGSVVGAFVGCLLGLFVFGIEPTAAIFTIVFGALGLLYKGKRVVSVG